MKRDVQRGCKIERAAPDRWRAALELVFCEISAETREPHIAALLDEAQRKERDLSGLFVARKDERVVAAVWGSGATGRVAILWPPQTCEPQETASIDALLSAALEHLAQSDVRLAQAALGVDAHERAALLLRHDFSHMADLLYMACPVGPRPPHSPEGPFEFVVSDEIDAARLAEVVAATYEQTLDCPALNGVREIDEVLAGYRACGIFEPALWLIVRRGARDVGCLLLADHPEHDQFEIVYAGLVPAARGHHEGTWLARAALARAGRTEGVHAL